MNKMFKAVISIPTMGRFSKCIDINNVPKDMPKESEDILKLVVISEMIKMFNNNLFISVYNIHDNCKSIINTKKIDKLNILNIEAI